MSNKDINNNKQRLKDRVIKGVTLACLLVIVSMLAVGCSKSSKEDTRDNSIEETMKEPTASPIAEPTPTEDLGPTLTGEPEVTAEPTQAEEQDLEVEPTPTKKPASTEKPSPTKKPTTATETDGMKDFIPSEEVLHSATAFTQGDYLFYKAGKLSKTRIVSENLKTSKVYEITTIEDTYFNSSEFYLKGSEIYYHAEGDIYRVGVNGKNKTRLFKGTATILGMKENSLFALDHKAREIICINETGEKRSLVKLNSIDSLEVVMVQDGFYYINKSTNNTLKGNDPLDRLYYIDFEGNKKTEVHADLDIYNMKVQQNEVFFLAVSDTPVAMKLIKVKDRKATAIYSITREDFESQGGNWLDKNSFTLLGVNGTHAYYGIDFNKGIEMMNIYSVGIDGKNPGLYLNAYDIEGINLAAYFRRGDIDGDYLKIVFDCDEDPVEVYLIDLKDNSSIQFEGGYYLSATIDVEGDYVYYLKSSEYDHYGEKSEAYEYGRRKISELEGSIK